MTDDKKRKRATKSELRERADAVGDMVNKGVPLRQAVKVHAVEAGDNLTAAQVNERARDMRNLPEYRAKINVKKDKMELRTVEALEKIDRDIINYLDSCDINEKIEIAKLFQSRMGFLSKEAGITLNVAILGDEGGTGKRKMNFNPNANEWAWDAQYGTYIHLPTAEAVEKKANFGFERHAACTKKCKWVEKERGMFGS